MTTLANRPNTALLVIDVQNGVVGEAYDRDNIIANIATLIDKARAAGVERRLDPAQQRRTACRQRNLAVRA